jgi:hypothetical protein
MANSIRSFDGFWVVDENGKEGKWFPTKEEAEFAIGESFKYEPNIKKILIPALRYEKIPPATS